MERTTPVTSWTTEHKASRLHVHATLELQGVDDDDGRPRAVVIIPQALANGVEVEGRLFLQLREKFVRWIDMANDKAERRFGWHVHGPSSLRRSGGSFVDSLPDGARRLLWSWAESWADSVVTADAIRESHVQQLADRAAAHRDKAAELTRQAEAEVQSGLHLTNLAGEIRDSLSLFAVLQHGSKLLGTWPTLHLALRQVEDHVASRGGRYPLCAYDFPQILNVLTGDWIAHPRAKELEREEAQR